MADVLVRAPHLTDVVAVATRMRAADVAECNACGHYDLHAALVDNLQRSVKAWAVLVDNEPACLMGVTAGDGLFGGVGVPWLLGTDVMTRNRRAFMRTAPGYIRQMLNAFPHLLNYVHAENTRAVSWLRRVGFTLEPPEPYGPHGVPFHRFEMRA